MPSILAVRFKGRIDIKQRDDFTLRLLRLERPMTATILPDTPSVQGMLRRVQHYVAWTPADYGVVRLLLEKRGEFSSTKKLTAKALKEAGYSSIMQLARNLAEGKLELHRLPVLKPFFRLAPPTGGFKARKSRLAQQGGIFGQSPNLVEIVKRMV